MSTVVYVSNDHLVRMIKTIPRGRVFKISYFHMGQNKIESRLGQNRIPSPRKTNMKISNNVLRYYDLSKGGIRGPIKDNIRSVKYRGITYKVK